MIDPSIWEDEDFGKLSDKAKILFISCISNADDEGRLSGNPKNLRANAFRYENISDKTIFQLRNEISLNLKSFKVYSVNGSEYIALLKWKDYQTQRDDRIKPSKIPPPTIEDLTDKPPSTDSQVSAQVKLSKVKLSKVNICLSEPEIGSDGKRLLEYFGKKFQELYKEKYPASFGRDIKLLKNIIKEYGYEKSHHIVELFFLFAKTDDFIKGNPSVPVLQGKLAFLISQLNKYEEWEYAKEEKEWTEKI